MTDRFARETYPYSMINTNNNLQTAKLASKLSEGLYRNVRGMLLRGLDHKALLATAEIRDQTNYDKTLAFMQKLGLNDLAKKAITLGEERDADALNGKRIGGQDADIRDLMKRQEGSKFKAASRLVGSTSGSEMLKISSRKVNKVVKKEFNYVSEMADSTNRTNGFKGNRFMKFLNHGDEPEIVKPKEEIEETNEPIQEEEMEEEKENERRVKRRRKQNRMLGKLGEMALDASQRQKVYK